MTASVILFKHRQYCSGVSQTWLYAQQFFYFEFTESQNSGAALGMNHWCFSCGPTHITHVCVCSYTHIHARSSAVKNTPTVKSYRSVVVDTFTSDCFFGISDSWWCYANGANSVCTVRGFWGIFFGFTADLNWHQLKVNFSCRLLICLMCFYEIQSDLVDY